jgi:hypothetical protein
MRRMGFRWKPKMDWRKWDLYEGLFFPGRYIMSYPSARRGTGNHHFLGR